MQVTVEQGIIDARFEEYGEERQRAIWAMGILTAQEVSFLDNERLHAQARLARGIAPYSAIDFVLEAARDVEKMSVDVVINRDVL